MKEESKSNPVEVFAGSLWQAQIVKTMIENEGIEVFLYNEFEGLNNSLFYSVAESNLVRVVVAEADLADAEIVVQEFEKNMNAESPQVAE